MCLDFLVELLEGGLQGFTRGEVFGGWKCEALLLEVVEAVLGFLELVLERGESGGALVELGDFALE